MLAPLDNKSRAISKNWSWHFGLTSLPQALSCLALSLASPGGDICECITNPTTILQQGPSSRYLKSTVYLGKAQARPMRRQDVRWTKDYAECTRGAASYVASGCTVDEGLHRMYERSCVLCGGGRRITPNVREELRPIRWPMYILTPPGCMVYCWIL
jgi:hypothetical protein